MFRRLLVPVDGAELSAGAIDRSVALARQLGAAIIGFVVEPPTPFPSESESTSASARAASVEEQRTDEHARALLGRFEKHALQASVAFEGHSTHAQDIARAIIDAAAQHHCDMIVMVTHGRGRLSKLMHGSNTQAVLAGSTVALLVLH